MAASPIEILIFFLSVWLTIYVFSGFFNLKRRGVDISPLYLTIRTGRLNTFLERTAEKHPIFWRNYGNIGLILGFVEMALAAYFLLSNLYRFAYTPQTASPVVPFLPGVTVSLMWFPYVLIAISIAITIHETAHGIMASLEKVKVKSSGIVIAPITVGGFVEPDEEEFNKSSLRSKLRILAVGSLTNLTAGVLTLILMLAFFSPQSGILVTNTSSGGPAEASGIQEWDVIYSIDGYLTRNYGEMVDALARIKPGSIVLVETSRGPFYVATRPSSKNASIASIGIKALVNIMYHPLRFGESSTQFTYHLSLTLNWIFMLMTNLAIFNMLPLYPLDGEAFVYNILRERLKRGLKTTRIILNVLSFSLLGLNIALTFIRYGITPI